MWLTHFWHSWSQFFIFAWDVTAGGILRTGVLICLVSWGFNDYKPALVQMMAWHWNPQIAKFMGPAWGPPGSCRPQMGPMLAPCTMLSGISCLSEALWCHRSWSWLHIGSCNGFLSDGTCPGISLCLCPANERRRYIVTWSLIGWAHTQNDPCCLPCKILQHTLFYVPVPNLV